MFIFVQVQERRPADGGINHKTHGIHGVFRGLKFEPDAEIGQKGAFCKDLEDKQADQMVVKRSKDRVTIKG